MSNKTKVVIVLFLLVLIPLIIFTLPFTSSLAQGVYNSLLRKSPPAISNKIIVADLKSNIIRSDKTTTHPIYNEGKQELGRLYVLRNPIEGQVLESGETYLNILVQIDKDSLSGNSDYIVWLEPQDENSDYINIGPLEEKIRYYENVYANVLETASFKLLVEDLQQPESGEEVSEAKINQPSNTILESDYINTH